MTEGHTNLKRFPHMLLHSAEREDGSQIITSCKRTRAMRKSRLEIDISVDFLQALQNQLLPQICGSHGRAEAVGDR